MARKKARKGSPAAKAKAGKTGTPKARKLNGQPAGLDLTTLADLVQQMDRREQVVAWRIEHIEQQLAHLQQILVSLNQIYENRRVNEWRDAEAARHLEFLRQLSQKAAGMPVGH